MSETITKVMNPELEKFLRANGLPANATDREAWEYHRQLAAEGTAFNGPLFAPDPPAPPETRAAPDLPSPPTPVLDDLDEAAITARVRQLMAQEYKRAEEIRDIGKIASLPADTVETLIVSGASVDTARASAFVHLQASNPAFGATATPGIKLGLEDRDKFRAAVVDGILQQRGVPLLDPDDNRVLRKPAPGSREFRAHSPMMLARHCLERAGIRTTDMGKTELAKRALVSHSVSDFPLLLGGIGSESLRAGYVLAEPTWKPLASTTNATDFRDMYTYSFAADLKFLPVNERGEYESAEAVESGEKYRIKRFGRLFNYSFEMLTNDRWDIFSDIPRGFGYKAGLLESDIVYNLITSNPRLSDNTPLFDASRGNIMTGAAFGRTSLDEAYQMLMAQTDENGDLLGLQPAFLLVSPADKTEAEILLDSTGNPMDHKNEAVKNPFRGMAQLIVDQRVKRGSWYLLASPLIAPIFQAAWLDGEPGPHIEDETDFLTDGVRIKARHCFGAGLVGWRGAIFNPGP